MTLWMPRKWCGSSSAISSRSPRLPSCEGRTLNGSFVILDEAQNTTSEQMKMFLTRIGFGSNAVVTGDVTQIDLPPGKTSGLVESAEILADIPGIAFLHFDPTDVVRHPLVQSIIRAYDRKKRESRPGSLSDATSTES